VRFWDTGRICLRFFLLEDMAGWDQQNATRNPWAAEHVQILGKEAYIPNLLIHIH
jgi:hypothetical protein